MSRKIDNNSASKKVTFAPDMEDTSDESSVKKTALKTPNNKRRQYKAHEQQKIQTYLSIFFIIFFGCAAGAAFLGVSITSTKTEKQDEFDRKASSLVHEIEATWDDYENAGLWIHEACRTRNITRKEFRGLYEYLRSGGLDFQAAEFIPNITHDLRDEFEAEALAYYTENYPDINYRGFVGFEPVSPGSTELSVQTRSEQQFYFVVHFVEPVEPNAAAIHLDLYSSAKRRATIDSALQTWQPALTDRLKLVQETDASAYSVLLMHPGIPLESDPSVKPRDLSLMVIRIPSLLERATRKQANSLSVYIYDSTSSQQIDDNSETPPQFLGGIQVEVHDDFSTTSEFVEEIELSDLRQQSTPVAIYRESIEISSRTWEVVVVPLENTFEDGPNLELLGGVLIFVCTFALAVWMYTNMVRNDKMQQLEAQSEAERKIVTSLFPSNIRARLIQDAANDTEADSGARNKMSSADIPLSSEKIFGSKPLADFFTEVTIMFADLVGFTAWSSARDPTQVFTLLEVIYHSFDILAKRREVFKLETVGDCYVAVCGLPDYRKDHAEIMAEFATDCLIKLHELTSSLEVTMGPDTADLDIRIGLHSGPVTAGVLRGDKGRFQLFGDTMNTANRIESTGARSKIHVSLETAELLKSAGKNHWLTERTDAVFAKGKGELKTFWLDINSGSLDHEALPEQKPVVNVSSAPPLPLASPSVTKPTANAQVNALKEANHERRMERLVNWSVDVFSRLLKLVIAKRIAQGKVPTPYAPGGMFPRNASDLFGEVKDVICMPECDDAADFEQKVDIDSINLDPDVVSQLHEYISVIAELYHRNPFHNFEHAGHVLMSVCKLMSRIVAPRDITEGGGDTKESYAAHLHNATFGIASDPLTRFAAAFSALIHDVDHPGVPNSTLVSENTSMATTYNFKSVAEQNSFDLSWDLLMSSRYTKLVGCLCADQEELKRFRQLVVNMVMATDVMDKSIGAQRKARWEKAFSEQSIKEDPEVNFNRRATIVIEHLIQASDVSHTMQHWHVYKKWNERLFYEMYKSYKAGRLTFDPSEKWYEGEIGFFDFYLIPLAKKLDTCGVFGVSSDELLNYTEANRKEWEKKGKDIVKSYLETYKELYE